MLQGQKKTDTPEDQNLQQEASSEQLTIEQSFALLEETINKLSDQDLPLEESFTLFERGMKVLRGCSAKIDEVEKKVKAIGEDGRVEDFE